MVARDVALSALFDARAKLAELIVGWSPEPARSEAERRAQADKLNQLILERDKVNGAINAVIAAAFQAIPTPELEKATRELAQSARDLEAFGDSIAQLNEVLRVADLVVQGAAKVVSLAAGGGLPV